MKKIKFNNIAAYITGQVILSLGVVLAVKADFGISVATSPAYVLSRIIDAVSFGTFNYIYQGFVFVLMLLIIREIRLNYFMSFLTAVVFGYMIDLWTFLLNSISLQTPAERIMVLLASIVMMCFAIATFLSSGLPLLPFDIFVRKLSEKYGFRFGRAKLVFDLSNLVVAVVLSFLFLGRLEGIFWGTLFFGLVLGPGIGIILKLYARFVVITGRLPGFMIESDKAV